ncbi:hypothetical protein Cco03nite_58130 [Catellatospora coxensis]|uniref:Uncharacterized protein n=1 Tax=Catellatospora coxensis TaxID=310354 RepID=A0A8J3KUZ8_9ACTN|nr:hypothetical protein Cco03nite_58130 [Catellatospora coxensis]
MPSTVTVPYPPSVASACSTTFWYSPCGQPAGVGLDVGFFVGDGTTLGDGSALGSGALDAGAGTG